MILPAGKDLNQLHATITDRSPSQPINIGRVVRAFFKVEKESLTFATIGDEAEETLKSFETAANRYELRKVDTTAGKRLPRSELWSVEPQKKSALPLKPEMERFKFDVPPK